MNEKKLIQVGYFPNGFMAECMNWCGWLAHHNITVTSHPVGGDIAVEADEFNAKAVWGMQIANPARFGNCPAIAKYLAIAKGDETKKDRDFIKDFYAKDATWETKVALAEAYMKEETVVEEVDEEEPPKTKIGKCCCCKKVKEVIFDVCPYDAEMNGETKKVWKCLDCWNAACDDI